MVVQREYIDSPEGVGGLGADREGVWRVLGVGGSAGPPLG